MKKAIICTLCAIAALNAAACGQVDKNVQINDTSTADANTTFDEDTTTAHDKDSSYTLEEALSYVNSVLQQYDENTDFKKMDIYEKKDILTPVMDELVEDGYIKKYSFLMDSHPASLSYFFPSGTHGLYFLEDFAPGVN